MIPLALRVTNFKSFRGEQSFEFPAAPGLYLMQGVNEAEPRLEHNAAGKSTLWEALTWCWFGKTSKGLKAGDVCNWQAEKGTAVEFDFMLDDNRFVLTMRRTWGPISWTLTEDADGPTIDLAKEKDNPAMARLALEFEPWLSAVLMAQGEPMFLDLKRDAQAALFSSVMGLDAWVEYSARAGKMAVDADRELRESERDLAALEGEREGLNSHEDRGMAAAWEVDWKLRLNEIADRFEAAVARRDAPAAALRETEEDELNARALVAESQPDAGLVKDTQRAAADVSDYNMMLEMCRKDAAKLADDCEHVLRNKTCPMCGQSARGPSIGEKINKDAHKLASEVALNEREYKAACARHSELSDRLRVQENRNDDARIRLGDAKDAVEEARRAVAEIDRELDLLDRDSARVQAETNPYTDMEARAAERRLQLDGEIDASREKIQAQGERASLHQFWVRGFKELRLSLIAEALTELEIEVNSCCGALGLVGWELRFEVDRETKGGAVQRGFNCLVRSPHNDRQVPWESWSGGEAQRLRIAAQMGLANLVRSRTGATIALEVWDEPTAGLSAQGIADLLDCLSERALRERRAVWIVDHRSHSFGGFAGGATITKTREGSVISVN